MLAHLCRGDAADPGHTRCLLGHQDADAAELERRILARVAGTEPAGTGPAGVGPGAGSGAGGVVDEAADGAS